MTFIDSNVLIDVFEADPRWEQWSAERLEQQISDGNGLINPVVVAELSPGYGSLPELLEVLAGAAIAIVPFEEDVAFLAGTRFAAYRRDRLTPERNRVLADFLIGAHAQILHVPLLTRDPTIYRRFFPDLALITPESHP